MVAKPTITISHVEELFTDDIGQVWSPAKVVLSWSAANGLRAPSITIDVIAPARAMMTLEELRAAHLQGAHDVIQSALLSLEEIGAPQVARTTEGKKVF